MRQVRREGRREHEWMGSIVTGFYVYTYLVAQLCAKTIVLHSEIL